MSILAEDQQDISQTFATSNKPEESRLQGISYHFAENGAPIIDGCIASIQCEVTERADAGDHTVFFGRVSDATQERDAPPLLFYQGKYRKLA